MIHLLTIIISVAKPQSRGQIMPCLPMEEDDA